jgi:hypothetical protein
MSLIRFQSEGFSPSRLASLNVRPHFVRRDRERGARASVQRLRNRVRELRATVPVFFDRVNLHVISFGGGSRSARVRFIRSRTRKRKR